jgi:guanyl-specific ribonuclease Sa
LENVVLYLELYDSLPDNYITKSEAQALGWSGGAVDKYQEGAAIGGDRFGNREGILPKESGRSYTECDLNTLGQSARGAERLVFSNDGLYFYTNDHYSTFTQYIVTDDWEVAAQ